MQVSVLRRGWRFPRGWRASRDTTLFVAGLVGIAYETFVTQVDRPSLLVLFGGMIGLPAFFRADERSDRAKERERRSKSGTNEDES
jgi:Na+/H+ antiporter NhaD/arsenite permease-like protein